MSKKKRNHARGETGFEDWGGYMAAKKAKLEDQFRDKASKEFKETSKLFEGIAIFVNGYTDPTSDVLRRLMMMHGGVYHHYMRPKITTHIIASNLPHSKIVAYRKSQNPVPICKPQWITDSITAGKILNFQDYLLYSNNTNARPLAYKLNVKDGKFQSIKSAKTGTEVSSSSDKERGTIQANILNKNTTNKDTLKQNKLATPRSPGTEVSSSSDQEKATIKANISNEDTTGNDILQQNKLAIPQSSSARTGVQSTRDAEFVSAFYSNSRLHYIATMGATFKNYVNELRDKSDGTFLGLERLTRSSKASNASVSAGRESDSEDDYGFRTTKASERERVIMHIDMDCFFVSVGIRNRPELQGLPVAVAHAKGNKQHGTGHDSKEEFGSTSEVASCSYEARKTGVKNGMFLGEALKLCPSLKVISYDFEGYKEVSYALYDIVASYTLDIEAVSCDELYANCTKVLRASGLSPLEFASAIREEIKRRASCPVSTGFGNNKLLARLATRKAKPDNQFYLTDRNAESYIRTLNVRDLPGVGRTTTQKLHEMDVHTCEELQMISLGVLQKEFGKKIGEQLHKMCRGLDDTKLNLEHVRKSVSAEINYGIRFRNNEDGVDFLSKLSTEVCDRLTAARAKGRCITLKLMIRAEEAPSEPLKFMGHGLCNYITRSKNLMTAVDDVSIIKKKAISIWNELRPTAEDVRGIGIQISRLEICKTNQSKGTLKGFFGKTKSVHTSESTSGNNNKNQGNSNVAPGEDNPKTSVATESEASPAVRATSSTISTAARDPETLDDRQANEKHVAGVKKSSGGASSRSAQRQTSQENFFKHTKPSSGKSCKYEMPARVQDLDMSVLIELPQDIRNEILDEYKRNKERSRVEASKADSSSEVNAPKGDESWSSRIRDDGKCIADNASEGGVAISRGDAMLPRTKDDRTTAASTTRPAEISRKNAAVDKADTFILQNLNILHNNENVDEHQEMLIDLVNHLFTLPLQQVKMQIQTWVTKSNAVNEVDFLSLATFLSMLPQKKRITDLCILLKTMHRCTTKTGNCIWHRTYRRTVKHVQRYMQIEYSSNLMVPSIRCNDRRCNDSD